jgi:hypothetical protein
MLGHVEKEQVVCKMAIFVHLFSKYSVGLQRERFAVQIQSVILLERGTSINDARQFSEKFDLPMYPFQF